MEVQNILRFGAAITVVTTAVAAVIIRRRRQRVILQRRSPYVWERTRIRDFWERIVTEEFTDELWIQNFRMTRDTFNELCDAIEPLVEPHMSCPREAVPTRKRVAIALYKLATCSEYRAVGETFGVSKTTVHRCVNAKKCFHCTFAIYLYIDTSEKPPHESVKTF